MLQNKNVISSYWIPSSCGRDLLVDDKTAEEFTLYMKKFTDLYSSLSIIVQTYTSRPHPVILDLGCGPGLLSVEIQKQIPDSMVIGIDPLIKMLVLANKNMEETGFRGFNPILGVSEKIAVKNEKEGDAIAVCSMISNRAGEQKSIVTMQQGLFVNAF